MRLKHERVRDLKKYEQFFAAVKENVATRLDALEISDDELNDFLKQEESQIKGEYEDYLSGEGADDMTDDASFNASVDTVSMCLEYCY